MATPEQQEQRELRDRLVKSAIFAVDGVAMKGRPMLDAMPAAMTTRIIAEAVVGSLLAQGLITPLPDDQWPEWLTTDIPEHLAPDVEGRYRQWMGAVDRVTGDG